MIKGGIKSLDKEELFEQSKDLTFKIASFLMLKNRKPRKYGTDDLLYTTEADMIDLIGESEVISATDIVRIQNITKSAVSKTIAKLRKKQLIEQVVDPSDNRKMNLELTKKGKLVYEFHKKLDDTVDEFLRNQLEKCSDGEIKAYLKIAAIQLKAMYDMVGLNEEK